MSQYLTPQEFADRTIMPIAQVQLLEQKRPGWLAATLTNESGRFDSRLRKRYAAPFAKPYTPTLLVWLCDVVTLRAYLALGVSPTDEQFDEVRRLAEQAETQLTEAANSETGLFDLPLRADTAQTGILNNTPLGYSERSPYVAFDEQARIGRGEDRRRGY